jgi:hypothetical protein
METSQNESPTSLELLIPWELPLDQHLSSADRNRIDRALRQLLHALENPSLQEALIRINQALEELGEIDTQTASIHSTKTALKAWEVEDYDRYFQIRHVCTEQSAICLVQGLLVTSQRFVEICLQTPWLDTQHIQQQKQGFISYIHLLRRIFDL